MKHGKVISILVIGIVIIAGLATVTGIYSSGGTGEYDYQTIRGHMVKIYGKGLYKHMSSDVAIQGIAQDYITLFLGIPLLLLSLISARRGSKRALFLLSGTLGYFFLTYLFYTAMAMYNIMFSAYVLLLSMSFFAFVLTLPSLGIETIKENLRSEKLLKNAGVFLMINASLIALLWLSVIIPPLLNGTIVPPDVQHYTTLIVQGYDLAIFLPLAFVSGWLAIKKSSLGYAATTIYMIFLTILMTSLNSKIIFMAKAGANVIPVIFIMPAIAMISITFSVLLLRNLQSGNLK